MGQCSWRLDLSLSVCLSITLCLSVSLSPSLSETFSHTLSLTLSPRELVQIVNRSVLAVGRDGRRVLRIGTF